MARLLNWSKYNTKIDLNRRVWVFTQTWCYWIILHWSQPQPDKFDESACRLISLYIGGRISKKSLTQFSLEDCSLEDIPLVDIILGLSIQPQLKILDLTNYEGEGMGRNSCLALESLLHWTTTDLYSLRLAGNSIGDEGMKIVSRGLANCKSLHSLDISSNNLGDDGVDSLVSALKNCTKLKNLYMTGNHGIAVKGCLTLSTLLEIPTWSYFTWPTTTLEMKRLSYLRVH